MASFKNTQKITKIEFKKNLNLFCPMGNGYYYAHLNVELAPKETIMDYCDVNKFLNELNGKKLIIEDIVEKVFTYISSYEPKHLKVSVEAESDIHFPVVVTKER